MKDLINVGVFSKGLSKKLELKTLLGINEFILNPADKTPVDYVVGWGRKKNTRKAREYAHNKKLKYSSLEDGFIHSMGQGVLGAESCSLVVDEEGIYYDATQPSDLEKFLANAADNCISSKKIARSQDLIKRIIQSNITKYNNGSLSFDDSILGKKKVILIVDQTAGDMSLKYGYATETIFNKMVHDAVNENPDSKIIVKTHPDVIAGKRKGSINFDILNPEITVLSDNINPIVLLKKVDIVYVATSQMGFEALMLGKKVICYGIPFYSLWGLTEDRSDINLPVRNRRKEKRSLEDVFYAAYIQYTRYLHPDTNVHCELEQIISYFEMQYSNKLKFQGQPFCINFTRWKQNHIRSFLSVYFENEQDLNFIANIHQAEKKGYGFDSQIITWASKDQTEVSKIIKKWGGDPWYIEDGFIRSTGLGTDLTAPASLVLDKTGIYYDPTNPCDLEMILQNKVFSEDEIKRTEALKNSLLENELSKYNLGSEFKKSSLVNVKTNQKVILIPGQVEDDASIKKGCIDINTNAALIKVVRDKDTDAYLIYKPHPDVVSGNRKGKVDKQTLEEYCDLVLLDSSITDCLAVVDEVHTMTSLVGFEALLRDLKVVCYGLPFYSNWGLTEDRHRLERRTRKITINELVAATLIDYPLYINWQTGGFTTPEVIVKQLKEQIEKQGGKRSNQVFWLTRVLRKIKNYSKGVLLLR